MSKGKEIKVAIDTEQSDPREYIVIKTNNWVAKFSKTENDQKAKKIQDLINNRKEFAQELYQYVISKMGYKKVKGKDFDPGDVFDEEEFLKICQVWKEHNDIDEEPEQKTVEESSK